MNVLLINNDTTPENWTELQAVCRSLDFAVTTIHHRDIPTIDTTQFDVAILSGGWWYDDDAELLREYAAELDFINTTSIPVLGICIGMQLMHVALEKTVPLLDQEQNGFKQITVTTEGQRLFDLPETTTVFKNHTRGVTEEDPMFEVLAYSPGHAEIIRHTTRPILGVQFHPESESTVESASILLTKLLHAVVTSN